VRGIVQLVLVLCAALACAACTVASGQSTGGSDSIQARELRAHVRLLADDSLAGRDTGEPGVERAERYVAGIFNRVGLKPLPGQDDFYLDFPLYRQGFDAEATTLVLEIGDTTRTARAGVDFRPFGFSDEGTVEGEIVFAGYGITAPEHAYDDYDGLDVEGKIALVFRHEPGETDPESVFDGASSSEHALFATKARNAREHGARGMILVTDPLHHGPGDDLRLGGTLRLEPPEQDAGAGDGAESEEHEAPFLSVQISRPIARELVFPSKRTLEKLQRAVEGGERPAVLPLSGARVTLSVKRQGTVETVPARNVAGVLPGRDETLKHEWILIGGHHDHIGAFEGEGDTVFNGADDNASGVSAVLELAQAFAARSEPPRRSIVFATFAAEERGLLGSRAMVDAGHVPTDDLVFMLNLDMIGRNSDRDVTVFGDGFARGLRDVVEAANERHGLPLAFAGDSYEGNSDHDPFYRQSVPFSFFFTGTHPDYHQLGDHISKLDFKRMQSITRLAYDTVFALAERDVALSFVHNIGWLGARVEVVEDGPSGAEAVVTGVEDASRAAAAGLRKGDAVLGFDDEVVGNPREAARRFGDVDPGAKVVLSLRRDGEPVKLEVERARTGYLGVFPAAVDEDLRQAYGLPAGQGILLRRVVPEGPAAEGGLREGDVVARISGQPVGRSNLGARLSQIGAGETVTVHVIRGGERLDLEITLGQRPERG
jgi:hypothetical protein